MVRRKFAEAWSFLRIHFGVYNACEQSSSEQHFCSAVQIDPWVRCEWRAVPHACGLSAGRIFHRRKSEVLYTYRKLTASNPNTADKTRPNGLSLGYHGWPIALHAVAKKTFAAARPTLRQECSWKDAAPVGTDRQRTHVVAASLPSSQCSPRVTQALTCTTGETIDFKMNFSMSMVIKMLNLRRTVNICGGGEPGNEARKVGRGKLTGPKSGMNSIANILAVLRSENTKTR